ncbi:hypothetical protein NG799_06405 [Laspinema sp. D1]|uniref:CRISPR-associated protein n=1 Tax=Laspinema palackyanum D2a TaxID=2953684 RepID=A0ABT2MRA3_9CYAN|nr:hypothetical protein [Laspinema sp. D2a]
MEKTEKTGLILILSSDTVDTYVNVICHTYSDYNIQNIHFCHISGASTGIRSDQAEDLKNKINTRLKKLAEAELKNDNTLYDDLINGIRFNPDITKIPAEDIGPILTQEVKSLGGQKKCLIDITTTTKSASQFVLAGCLIYGLRNLYEFHLSKRINKDTESTDLLLYHNLNSQEYKYVYLSDTLAIRRAYNSLSRKIALSMAAVVVSMLVLIISVTWISTSSVSIASILASAASLATVISLGLQMKEFTS